MHPNLLPAGKEESLLGLVWCPDVFLQIGRMLLPNSLQVALMVMIHVEVEGEPERVMELQVGF